MQPEKNSLSKWLVKSENRILGPYSFEQIGDLIQKKQISLIDEVRDSETRWLYVRENAEFKEVVESIRKELDSKLESTKTYQSFSKTEEMNKTKTKTDLVKFTDVNMEVQDISVVKEIIQGQQQEKMQFYQDELSKREKVKLYGLAQDSVIQEKVKTSASQFMIYVGLLFFMILASTAGFYFYQKFNQQKQEEAWAQQIKKYKFLGLDQKAVEIFGRLPLENQKKLLPQVIELLPLLETNGVVQMSEIESLKSASNLSLEQRSNIQLVQYWLAMQTQNYDLAQEFVVKASTLQPSSALVKENDAIVQLKKGRYQKAMDLYLELFKTESSGRYLFGMAISLMGLPNGERNKYINQMSQLIEKYTFVYYDYKKELLLAQLFFTKVDKNEELFKVTWNQFINTPCQLAAQFKKPLLLAPATYYWKDLAEYIKLVRPLLTSEETILLDVHNQIELSQISAASQYIALNSAKLKDSLVKQQLNMLIFNFQSRNADVIALEKTNSLDMKSELNQVVVALNKTENNSNVDLTSHMHYFKENKLVFYEDWITLVQLVKQKNPDAIRAFTRNHFLTVNNFLPALEAKSLVE